MSAPTSATRLPPWFLQQLNESDAPAALKRAASALERMPDTEYAFLRHIAEQIALPVGLDIDATLLGLFLPVLLNERLHTH